MTIKNLSVKGFKSLILDEAIDLGRVNCFIGANGVGKSNILEAFGVLGAAAKGTVDGEGLLRRGVRAGVPKLYKSSFASERAPAHIDLKVSNKQGAKYQVALLNPLDAPEPAWRYKTEFLYDGSLDVIASDARNSINLDPHSGYAALKQVELEVQNPAAKLIQSLQEYAIYCPNTPVLRGLVPDQQARVPIGLNGGNLAEAFNALLSHLEALGENGEDILEQVIELIDWVADIEVTQQAGSLLSSQVPRTKQLIKFTDRFMAKSRNELTAYDASEGALYVLFTAALCLLPQGPKVFAVDNLDQALNPRLLARLTSHLSDWLQVNGDERQLLFTAHNPAVLDGLDITDDGVRLFAVERNSNGLTRVRRVRLDQKLAQMHKEYPLSRLWLMGHLGAVPNV